MSHQFFFIQHSGWLHVNVGPSVARALTRSETQHPTPLRSYDAFSGWRQRMNFTTSRSNFPSTLKKHSGRCWSNYMQIPRSPDTQNESSLQTFALTQLMCCWFSSPEISGPPGLQPTALLRLTGAPAYLEQVDAFDQVSCRTLHTSLMISRECTAKQLQHWGP